MRKLKILAVYAHPADCVTDAGGTLALHAQNGDDVVAMAITHGARMHPNAVLEELRKKHPDQARALASREEIIKTKSDELRAALEILGVKRVILLNEDDNYVRVEPEIVHRIAKVLAEEQPDIIITDYPVSPALPDTHTLATLMIQAAITEVAMYVDNMDGKKRVNIKQVFLTKLPVTARSALALSGVRNDLFIDITPVLALKLQAMNCFISQGYDGPFAYKFLESHDGDRGRSAGVNFAEAFVRLRNETHSLLPLTDHAIALDELTSHRAYSTVCVRDIKE